MYYIYYIPRANYIGKTLCQRLIKRRKTLSDIYDDGLNVRKKEHVRNGKMKLEDEILPICKVPSEGVANMLEQMLIRDFSPILGNKQYIILGDEKYQTYREKVESYGNDYLKIVKKFRKQITSVFLKGWWFISEPDSSNDIRENLFHHLCHQITEDRDEYLEQAS